MSGGAVSDRYKKSGRNAAFRYAFAFALPFLLFHHDHVTGATNRDEYVPEIRPAIRGTEKVSSEV